MSTPTGAQDLVVRRLAGALVGRVASGQENHAAAALLACLHGSTLSLQELEKEFAQYAYFLGAPAWETLDSASEGGIANVQMPPAGAAGDIRSLAHGLNALRDLRGLDLPLPRRGELIDLSGLRVGPAREVALYLDFNRAADCLIKAPTAVRVRAQGDLLARGQVCKPLVAYTDAQGELTGDHHVVEGLIYWGKPPALAVIPQDNGDPRAAQARALRLNLNTQAQFEEPIRTFGVHSNRAIVCRDIALWVAQAWTRRRADKLARRDPELAQRQLTTAAELRKLIRSSITADLDTLQEKTAAAVFTWTRFGQALHALCAQMSPGQHRVFFLEMSMHALTVELRIKPSRSGTGEARAVVSFFDPNRTVAVLKKRAHDLRDLETQAASLTDWLPGLASHYRGADDARILIDAGGTDDMRIACLRELPTPDVPATSQQADLPSLHGFNDTVLASASALHWLVYAGNANQVRSSVQAVVSGCADPKALSVRLKAMQGDSSALERTLRCGRIPPLEAWITAILEIPPSRLGAGGWLELVNPVMALPGPFGPVRVLQTACTLSPAYVAMYAKAVLTSEGTPMDLAARTALLVGSDPPMPILSSVLATLMFHPPALHAKIHESIHALLHTVLGASGFSRDEQLVLLRGPGASAGEAHAWVKPFAALMRLDNAIPAAILLCAAYEHWDSNGPAALAPTLDVDTVLAALRGATNDASSITWGQRLAQLHNTHDCNSQADLAAMRVGGATLPVLTAASAMQDPFHAAAVVRMGLCNSSATLERWKLPRSSAHGALLHALAQASASPRRAQQALYELVYEIAGATNEKTLERCCHVLGAIDVFRSSQGLGTAAQAALQSQPVHRDAAAAMVCAVVESRSAGPYRSDLLKALGIELPQVLGEPPAGWPEGELHWSARILYALPKAGLNAQLAEAMYVRAADLPLGYKLPVSGARAAKAEQEVLDAFSLNLKDSRHDIRLGTLPMEEARRLLRQLKPLRLDSNPALVVCQAKRQFPELALWEARGDRAPVSKRSRGDAIYLVPLRCVQPTGAREADFETVGPWDDAQLTEPPAVRVHHVAPTSDAQLSAKCLSLAGADPALDKECRKAGLHAVGRDPLDAALLLCVADFELSSPHLQRFKTVHPDDAKTTQRSQVFYRIARAQLKVLVS